MQKPHELILHIGHYKTGTTALQVFMEQNRTVLARAGLTYATSASRNSKHSPLAFALLREAGVTSLMYGFNYPQTAAELWHTLFDEVRALPKRQALLVSSEEFMRLGAHPAAATILRDILAEAPDVRVRVIAYLRPPQAHLRSWYNQMVKLRHPVAGFDAALRSQFEPIHWDYAQALSPWIEMLGTEAVILRGFDDTLRDGDALYRDFLEALGYALPGNCAMPIKDPNPRLDDRLLPLRRALNHTRLPRKATEQIMRVAEEALATFDGPGDGTEMAQIREAAQSGIERLSHLPHAGFDVQRILADLPRASDPQDQTVEALVAILSHEITQVQTAQRKMMARLAKLEASLGPDGADDG
jgi:hypothetical protein